MANVTSPFTTYSDTTPQKRVITDVISLIDPTDTPLIAALGGLDGAMGKFRLVNWPSTTVEWLEDTHIPMATTFNESATITSTIVTLSCTDASIFQPGHIISAGTEYMWVSSVSGNLITVTRGVGGGTNVTQASLAAVTVVGMARLESAESAAGTFTDRTVGSNVTQIFHQEVKVSRSQERISQYGISSEMNYQKDKAIPNLMRQIEKHLLYNKALAAGSATTPRIAGGIQSFVSTNKVSGATLAQSQFENAVLSAYNNGGGGPFIGILNPVNMQKVKNFYDSTGVASTTILRVGTDQRSVGMNVDTINTPFGVVNLIMDRWAPTTIIDIIDPKHAGLLTYDPFQWKDLAITGDYQRAEVVGEFSFCLRQEKAHALLTNVS